MSSLDIHRKWQEAESIAAEAELLSPAAVSGSITPEKIEVANATQLSAQAKEVVQETLILDHRKSSSGAFIIGGLITSLLGVGAFLGYKHIMEEKADAVSQSITGESSTSQQNLASIDVGQASDVVRDTGCQRQLTSIEGLESAFTHNGSNTDLCWEIGETVQQQGVSTGVVTFWGQSPHAGKLDDSIMHDKFESGDISPSELNAFFREYIIANSVETHFVLVDRTDQPYSWEMNNGSTNVVVDLREVSTP